MTLNSSSGTCLEQPTSDFSSSLKEIYDQNNSQKKPWELFNVGSNLTLQGRLIGFPNLQYFEALTVTIRDVISISGSELLPDDFLTEAGVLNRLTIRNTLNVTIPKFYLEKLFRSNTNRLKVTMELEITNKQKDSLASRNASRLRKLNQVEITNEMRMILRALDAIFLAAQFFACHRKDQFRNVLILLNRKKNT